MNIRRLRRLMQADARSNPGWHLDALKARTLLAEVRLERCVYEWQQAEPRPLRIAAWQGARFAGSVFQWLFFQSEISGEVSIGEGLRLPHPQSIVITRKASLGAHCSVYHNVTLARRTFVADEQCPRVGDRVVVGAGAILIGAVDVGADSVVGAGVVVARDVPAASLAVAAAPTISPRRPIEATDDGAAPEYPTVHPLDRRRQARAGQAT